MEQRTRMESKKKREEIEAEQHWERNFKKYEQMDVKEGFKYLDGQKLETWVYWKVKNKLKDLNRSLGRNNNVDY